MEWSRFAPYPVEDAASIDRHTTPHLQAEEETQASRPSGRRMLGSFFGALHHTLHPAFHTVQYMEYLHNSA